MGFNAVITYFGGLRNPSSHNKIAGVSGIAISLIAVGWSLFHMYTGYFPLQAMYQRIVFVALSMFIIAVIYPIKGKARPTKISWHSIVLAIVVAGISAYLAINYHVRADSIGMVTYTTDLVLGGIFIFLVLDACRRTSGWSFAIVSAVLLLYGRFGEIAPSIFAHKDYDADRIISGLFLTTEGIFGSITGITATFIFIFILFGSFLRYSGAGDFFLNISNSLMGRRRGGAAKVAVIASSLFGMISGSAMANVAGTGQFTIPLMKRTGYKPAFAGAVEAVSGSGGQLMPPVMGGSAFIMMEVLGVSYFYICMSAIIIGVLYYVAAFMMVDIEAAKTGLVGLEASELPSARDSLRKGWHYILPVVILIGCLVADMSATRAAFWGTLAVPVVSWFRREGRMGLKEIFWALEDAAYTACSLAGIVIAMGIVVGIITLTGLGLTLSSILLDLAGGSLLLLLVLAMLTSLVLGMGVPIICAYIILSVLVCPAMIELGVVPIAAHLFVFYFAILSAITPPVAPAAFVAAGIAEAPMMKTAVYACQIGLALVILPYLMIYDRGLLMIGSCFDIVSATARALASIIALVACLQGYFFTKIEKSLRVVMLLAAAGLIIPEVISTIVGYVAVAGVLAWNYYKRGRASVAAAVKVAQS